MTGSTLGTKAVNFLVEGATVRTAPVAAVFGAFDVPGRSFERVMDRQRRKHGGLWVGGHAVLTTDAVTLTASGVNKALHHGLRPVVVPIARLTSVDVQRAFVTDIIVLGTSRRVVKLRCFGARAFAERIRALR